MASLQPGVTEIVLRPAIDTPELRAQTDDADDRIDHLATLCGAGLADALGARGAQRIAWRDLRAMQRAAVS